MATTLFELDATQRDDLGKGSSRRLRRLQDRIPGIVYGGAKKPESISLEQRVVRKALKNEAFYSHILTLNINNQAEKVILKAMQRHPFKPIIQHMDFQRVDMNKPLHMNVPLHFINENTSLGVQAGGKVSHQVSELAISCLPSDLPEFIEVDLANMALNDILHISDLKLPKGVTSTALSHGTDNDMSVVSIHLPRVAIEEVVVETESETATNDTAKAASTADSEKKADTKKDKK